MRILLLGLALGAAIPAHATGLADLASKLDAISGICADMATQAKSADSMAELEAQISERRESQRVRHAVELYSIGNGRRDTELHRIHLLQESARRLSAETQERIQASVERREQISECIASALEQGKQAHRDSRGPKPVPAAVDLVSAWIANTETISVQDPQGREEPRAVWRREKARAELD